MSPAFNNVPAGAPGKPIPFSLHIPDQALADFRSLLQLSRIGPSTWYTEKQDGRFGISRDWLTRAKEAWLQFDWRKVEERVNALPNFKIDVQSNGDLHNIHFTALFSTRQDAVPIIFMHGWPGSFLEFLPMLELLVQKYTPETLPFHVIVPSIPDYGLSTRNSIDEEMTLPIAAQVMNELMVQLGLGQGYVAQGGDVGSMLARIMSSKFSGCKAYHREFNSLLHMHMRELYIKRIADPTGS